MHQGCDTLVCKKNDTCNNNKKYHPLQKNDTSPIKKINNVFLFE